MSEVRINLSSGRAFVWTGTREQGVCVIKAMESVAEKGGITFEVFTHNCLRYVLKGGDWRDGLMPGLLALVLQSETRNPEHPGRIVEYLDNTDFTVAIAGDNERFEISANATSRLHS
jgi:hypothetical protein